MNQKYPHGCPGTMRNISSARFFILLTLLILFISCDSKQKHIAAEYINKGIDLDKSGKYEDAIDCYGKAIEIKPDDYVAWNNKGAVLGKREIEYFLKQQKIEADDSFFKPCNNLQIIERLLNNLINAFESTAQTDKVDRIKRLLKIFR